MHEWRNKLFVFSVMFFLFMLPFGGHIAAPITTIFILLWLIDFDWKDKYERFKTNWLLMLPSLFYIIYLIGMFYTDDKYSGYSQLETKLSLILGPVIFGTKAFPEELSQKKVILAFITGCFLAMLVCVSHSVYCFYDERWRVAQGLLVDTYTNYEFYYASLLSWFMHPSYFAMFLCVCIVYGFLQAFYNSDGYSKFQIRILLLLNVIFSLFIFFLASRLGLGVMLLTWFCVIVYFIIWKKMYLVGIFIFASTLLIFIALYKTLPVITSRFDSVIETLGNKNIDKTTTESSAARKLIWAAATDILRENWLIGVGTGDVEKTLLNKYEIIGMTGAKEHNLNAHNQFFQTFIAIGIAGFLTLLSMIFLPMYFAAKEKRFLFLIFLIIFALNIMVESMFEAEDGVLVFVFFYIVLQRIPVNHKLKA